ncbi:centrosomal protein of 41 kDa [Nematolebias whitei]|uniref:centrosomal protein of 41 kDa n=1 Tax=Nematolebias whitei TaxID=451745 RepID=UPI00189A07FB|nr:centrosomal protein of 41 kDa [Nematolebias whitei]
MSPPSNMSLPSDMSPPSNMSPSSNMTLVISGVGELNLDEISRQMAGEPVSSPSPLNTPYPDCPYLLLDVRDQDQYNHCHIISGLKVIAQKFPSGMVTGSFPASCLSSPTSKSRRSSAPQQLAQTAERRWRFTCDELTKIQEQLEETPLPTNSNSRTSSCLTTSRVPSTASGRLSSSSSASKTSSRIQSSRTWK